MPEALKNAANNKALEGVARLPDGRLLAITERTLDAHGNMIVMLVMLGSNLQPDVVEHSRQQERWQSDRIQPRASAYQICPPITFALIGNVCDDEA